MRFLFVVILLAAFATSAFADLTDDATSAIEAMMTSLERDQALELDGEHVIAPVSVEKFYAANAFSPSWTDPATVQSMLTALESIRDDGLDPDEYHSSVLIRIGPDKPKDPQVLALRDILLTDALHVVLYNLVFGKADPNRLDQDWNIDALYGELDPRGSASEEEYNAFFLQMISENRVEELFTMARPKLNVYLDLRTHYAFYRDLADQGEWPVIPSEGTLRRGDDDPRVAILRQRLSATRDFSGKNLSGTAFDEELETSVIAFQTRHGLEDDGIVGKGTFAALNVSAADRADMIRVNLERSRWVMHYDLGGHLVLVNIAAYHVWLIDGYDIVWRARVQVGKPFTRTPVFAEAMTYIEFNPTWTVPASIANRSILPKVKSDPGYLAGQGMVLLDSKGGEVSADTIDWATVTRMPYTVRQQPGPKNALGLVKFMFPNKHAVYLHDTPSRHNFGRSARAFSSGCIRVENPLDLATILLEDQSDWDRKRVDEVIESGKRTTARLSGPVPVLLMYWTAFVEADGSQNFREDIYGRDATLLEALEGPVIPRKEHQQ